jgi:hypothetical protein
MLKIENRRHHEGKLDMKRHNELWKNIVTTTAGILTLLALLLASKVFGGESENTPPARSAPADSGH